MQQRQQQRVRKFTIVPAMIASVPLAQWAATNGCCVHRLLKHAAACGRLEVLQHWAGDATWSAARVEAKLQVCAAAAEGGHLHVLQWLRTINCPWDASTCAAAARRGDLTVVQWLHAQGCPWDENACCEAAEGGHIEVAKYLFEQGCPWDGRVCCRAARYGQLSVLQFAHAHGCPWKHDEAHEYTTTSTEAVEGGHLELLQWAYANDCPVFVSGSIHTAAEHGHLNVIVWLRSISRDWSYEAQSACEVAAQSDQLAVLQWLHQNGCRLPHQLCLIAASVGNVEMLEWARSIGCPWDSDMIDQVCETPHTSPELGRKRLAAFEWALANGCPCNYDFRSAYLWLQQVVSHSAASARNRVKA
eukprot:TRINITY_DN3494_c0_g2_i1.p1 TRINITY_DN3494_c0_g2~~TRINITY_DN3494_c0_g2_i1.p1  ORF type:complete len:359 (-),score=31.87 TRINITY_DN3494_c0_g2_i1:256-1332(-)